MTSGSSMGWQRPDGRRADRMRPVRLELNYFGNAAGTVLAACGNTTVLCAASIQEDVPKWLQETGSGWLTAEYRMLPGATPERQRREWQKLSGRTQEIQRLIGRSLRAAVDLTQLGPRTIAIDADVLQADAGTRTIAIVGGYVALVLALRKLAAAGTLPAIATTPVAAVSVGLIEGEAFLDLNYDEDVAADVDCNVVMLGDATVGDLGLIEVQGTAEAGSFTRSQLNAILDRAEGGIRELLRAQQQALDSAAP